MSEAMKPYLDKQGKEVNFESKRLSFWLETEIKEQIQNLDKMIAEKRVGFITG
jgi:hypothetical protein